MKLHILEGISSVFVVGFGQILKGETSKGLILLLLFYFTIPALVYGSLAIDAVVFLWILGFSIIFAIMEWGYSVADALLKK